jgi:methyl-accepting chemotaxis protein WspA
MVSMGAILLLMLVTGLIAYVRLKGVSADAASAEHDSVAGLAAAGDLQTAMMGHYVLAREQAGLGASDPALAAKLEAKAREVAAAQREYEKTVFAAEDRELFDQTQRAWQAYLMAHRDVLAMARGTTVQGASEAMVRQKLDTAFEAVLTTLDTSANFNKGNAEAALQRVRADAGSTTAAILASVVLGLIVAIVGGYLVLRAVTEPLHHLTLSAGVISQGDFTQRATWNRRDEFGTLADGFNHMVDQLTMLVGQVQHSGIQVTTSVAEMAATAKEQQATANEVAATPTEIGATSREISATSKELVRTVHEVTGVAEQTANLAGNGQAGLQRMEETMRNIMDAAGTITAKLATLNEKAGNINQVVTTITKVADQTNLLSLNAAIEAEKAGEYGRGFAVVATEIRRLADQSAVATYDIEQMVKEMQSAVAAGVMSMDRFSEEVRRGVEVVRQVGEQLAQIIQQVQALTPRFDLVNEGMQAQATGAEQISEALTQLSEAAQQTAESLRQSNLAIQQLNDVAGGLKSSISRFKLRA